MARVNEATTIPTGTRPSVRGEFTRYGRCWSSSITQLIALSVELDDSGEWALDGSPTCAHWIGAMLDIEIGTAREWLRIGRALAELPTTSLAFANGDLSFTKVRSLTRVATAANEAELLEIAERKPTLKALGLFEQALALDPKFSVAELNLAQIDLREQKPEAAEARYQGIVARDPGNVQALLALSVMAERAQKPAKSLQWLEQAWDKNPNSLQVGLPLAQRYLQRGDRLKAGSILRQLETAQPNNPQVQSLLGNVLLASGDIAAAKVAYRRVTEIQPNRPEGWFMIATTYLQEKDDAGAQQALDHALSIEPKYVPAIAGKIELALRGKREAEMRRLIESLRAADPDSALPLKYEGDWEMQAGRPQNAVLSYASAYERSPNGPMAMQLAAARMRAGDRPGTLAALKDWLDRSPTDYVTRLQYAIELQNQKQTDAAIEQYRKILEINFRDVVALNNLAWLLRKDDPRRALRLAERAVRLRPEPRILETLGEVLIAGGDGKGQDFSPLKDAFARYARAVVLIGRDAGAIEAAVAGCGVPLIHARLACKSDKPALELAQTRYLPYGVLAKDTHDVVVRLAPPLVISREQLDEQILSSVPSSASTHISVAQSASLTAHIAPQETGKFAGHWLSGSQKAEHW